MNNIVIFEAENQPVQVRLEGESVWLTQAQVAELFAVTSQNVTMHLKNIYEEQELAEDSTCKDFLQVQTEGDREVKRKRKHYNLDAIISVGYRVNSRRATQFRQWATGVLRQHLVEGYSLNQQRLKERGIEFEQALDLLQVRRIDHGVRCTESPALVQRLARERVPLTVCPLSNVRLRVFPDLASHNLPELLAAGLCATVNSDDPAYFGGYVADNYVQLFAAQPQQLGAREAHRLAANGFEASFVDDATKAGWRRELDAAFAAAMR